MSKNVETAKEWIRDAPQVDYEVHRVTVDYTTGVTGTPNASPWNPKSKK